MLRLLASEHKNICVVGDPDQCVVAGTRITMADGTTKPVEQVRTGDEVLSRHDDGRFGPGRVTRTHEGSARNGIAIATTAGKRLVSTPEHMHFAGFAAGWMPQGAVVFLACDERLEFRVGTTATYTPGPGGRWNGSPA